jgi:hypothetical protein
MKNNLQTVDFIEYTYETAAFSWYLSPLQKTNRGERKEGRAHHYLSVYSVLK